MKRKKIEANENAQSNLIEAQYRLLPLIKISKQTKREEWEEALKRIYRTIQKARRHLKNQR